MIGFVKLAAALVVLVKAMRRRAPNPAADFTVSDGATSALRPPAPHAALPTPTSAPSVSFLTSEQWLALAFLRRNHEALYAAAPPGGRGAVSAGTGDLDGDDLISKSFTINPAGRIDPLGTIIDRA